MSCHLVAHFEKRFATGITINIDFCQQTDVFKVTALLGPSGCGKTTLLRCLAGLTDPDKGIIEFGDETWFSADRKIALSPQQRDIGFLFQEYALFPHLNVADNIEFGIRHLSGTRRHARLTEMLKHFDLTGLNRRWPHELSGGQQQRVALARALARRPKLLLLDEPLSSLDTVLREQLRTELRRLLAELETPVIVVTHDRVEAIALADRVAMMDAGTIQQVGSVQEVFMRPKNPALARLVGVETIAFGEILEIKDGLATVLVGQTHLLAVAPSESVRSVHVCIRGEDVALQRGMHGASSVRNHLPAKITSLTPEGALVRVGLDCGFELTSLITRPSCEELKLRVGDTITAMLKAPAIHLIPSESAPVCRTMG
jgi:molybdate transport system ATP-binding protein